MDGVERCIDDEIPFEIPESWEWVRLKSVGITQTGNTPSRAHPEYFGDVISFITPGDIQVEQISYDNQGLSCEGTSHARTTGKGSVLQVCIGGSIGKAAITECAVTFNQQINAIFPILCNSNYLLFAMTSPEFMKVMKETAGGTATPIINKSLWDNLLIPIPPINEQERIVARFEQIKHKITAL